MKTYLYARHPREDINPQIRKKILKERGKKCEQCQKEFSSVSSFQLDHIIPVSFCGKTLNDNLKILCYICHRKKTTFDIKALNIVKKIGVVKKEGRMWITLLQPDELIELYFQILEYLKIVNYYEENFWDIPNGEYL